MLSCAATLRSPPPQPLLAEPPGCAMALQRATLPPVRPGSAGTPAHRCLMLGRAHDSTAARQCGGHPGRQAQSISANWGLGHAAEPETPSQGSGGLARATAPSSPGAGGPAPLPGQRGWLPPQQGGPAAGTDLWGPSQAPAPLLECEWHLPAQERAKK